VTLSPSLFLLASRSGTARKSGESQSRLSFVTLFDSFSLGVGCCRPREQTGSTSSVKSLHNQIPSISLTLTRSRLKLSISWSSHAHPPTLLGLTFILNSSFTTQLPSLHHRHTASKFGLASVQYIAFLVQLHSFQHGFVCRLRSAYLRLPKHPLASCLATSAIATATILTLTISLSIPTTPSVSYLASAYPSGFASQKHLSFAPKPVYSISTSKSWHHLY